MWPIRKRDDGEGRGEQVVMKGVGGRKFGLQLFIACSTQVAFLALSYVRNKYLFLFNFVQ